MKEFSTTSYNNKGYASCEGRWDVIGALQDEEVIAQPVGKRKKRHIALLEEIKKASPHRVPAQCGHHPRCGGCVWQSMSYAHELEVKQNTIEKLFAPCEKIQPIIGADQRWLYRSKMEYTFSQDREGNRYLGLILAGSKGRVLTLNQCPISPNWFIPLLQKVEQWWRREELTAYHPHRNCGTLRYLTLREGKRTKKKMILLTVSGSPQDAVKREQLDRFLECVKESLPDEDPSVYLIIEQRIEKTPTQYYEMHLSGPVYLEEELHLQDRKLEFSISPRSFFQPNPPQFEKLLLAAEQMLPLDQIDHLLDLCCGIGTCGISFADRVEQITGIEINPYAVYDAKLNAEKNNLTNCTFHTGDSGAILQQLCQDPSWRPQAVIVDPPRAGLGQKTLSELLTLSPKYLLYISCNPHSQAEEVAIFFNAGYQIDTIQPVDQFPHTPHLENLVLLEKKDPLFP